MEPVTVSNVGNFIKTYLSAYNSYKQIMNDERNIFQKISDSFTKREHYDINEVFDEVENENIRIGELINLEGFLLKYGQGFKPYTHVN